MKYIRTKDGIYEVLEIYTYTKKKLGVIIESLGCKTQNENELKTIFFGDVLKQADTIEELCDFYVIWFTNREYPMLEIPQKGRRPNPSGLNLGECRFKEGYGAIWTDKGLIYVAKMNEKGELELI